MNLDDREHKLYDTDHKTYGPDNNRNHCQSVQAFTSSYIKIWQKAKPTAPFWVAMFVSKLLSLTYKHQNCRKHLKSQELFQTFFCGFHQLRYPIATYPDASSNQEKEEEEPEMKNSTFIAVIVVCLTIRALCFLFCGI